MGVQEFYIKLGWASANSVDKTRKKARRREEE